MGDNPLAVECRFHAMPRYPYGDDMVILYLAMLGDGYDMAMLAIKTMLGYGYPLLGYHLPGYAGRSEYPLLGYHLPRLCWDMWNTNLSGYIDLAWSASYV